MRALIAQLRPVPGDIDANVGRAERVLAEHPSAELAIFPELFLSGYEPARAEELAIAADEDPIGRIGVATASHAMAMVIGLIQRTRHGTCWSVGWLRR
jgi:predicted amidohydrolase